MTETELLSTILEEIKEYKICQYRQEHNKAYDKLNAELTRLSSKVQDVLKKLPKENKEFLEVYIAKHSELADKDCAYLYIQGAKDCVKVLKNLGVI